MRIRHALGCAGEGVYRRLEALEQARTEQTDQGCFALIGFRVGFMPVARGPVTSQSQFRVAFIGRQRLSEIIKEAWQHRIQAVLHLFDFGLGKANDLAAHAGNRFVGIILLDEVSGAPDGRFVQHIKEHIGPQSIGVLVSGGLEASPQRSYALAREGGIVPDKIGQQVVQIPERIIDRRGGHQHQLLWRMPLQHPAQGAHISCIRITQRVRFVNDDHLVLIDREAQAVLARAAERRQHRELLIRQHLELHAVLILEPVPGAIAQYGGRNQQDALTLLIDDVPDEFAADESFAQADAISDDHAIVVIKNAAGAEETIVLKAG